MSYYLSKEKIPYTKIKESVDNLLKKYPNLQDELCDLAFELAMEANSTNPDEPLDYTEQLDEIARGTFKRLTDRLIRIFNRRKMTMKLKVFIDQYGNKFYAKTIKELREQLPGRCAKMYVDGKDGKTRLWPRGCGMNKHTSQLRPELGGVVLCKAGKQTLERTKNGALVVTDGWLSDWVIIYDHCQTWAADGVFRFNMPIRQALTKIARSKNNA